VSSASLVAPQIAPSTCEYDTNTSDTGHPYRRTVDAVERLAGQRK
jgi:hypothetical protein